MRTDSAHSPRSLRKLLALGSGLDAQSSPRPALKPVSARPGAQPTAQLCHAEDQMKLSPGQLVYHATYGAGTVLKEWGSWYSCNACYAEVSNPPCCDNVRCSGRAIQVNGKQIYDVRFGREIISINICWLRGHKPLHEPKKKRGPYKKRKPQVRRNYEAEYAELSKQTLAA